jgi:DNA-binding NtrC family response regulator
VDRNATDANILSRDSSEASTEILIMDDDEDVLNLFSDFLKRQGYKVTPFTDPLSALKDIQERPQRYSLIITDIRMPGISGLELIKRVCKINPDIKVILMSAFDLNGDDLKQIGYEKFIQKPLHIHALAETIDKILRS